jgi:hypothetical protein
MSAALSRMEQVAAHFPLGAIAACSIAPRSPAIARCSFRVVGCHSFSAPSPPVSRNDPSGPAAIALTGPSCARAYTDATAAAVLVPGLAGASFSTASSAAISSAGVWYRSFGSSAISLRMIASTATGTSDRLAAADGGGSVSCLRSLAASVLPGNGTSPVRQKYIVPPSEYRSLRVSAARGFSACSGGT